MSVCVCVCECRRERERTSTKALYWLYTNTQTHRHTDTHTHTHRQTDRQTESYAAQLDDTQLIETVQTTHTHTTHSLPPTYKATSTTVIGCNTARSTDYRPVYVRGDHHTLSQTFLYLRPSSVVKVKPHEAESRDTWTFGVPDCLPKTEMLRGGNSSV